MASNVTNSGPDLMTVIVREAETLRYVAPCVVGFIILLGVVGNIVIILALLADKTKDLNKPPCSLHWIIQNISACDLGLLVFVCPLFAAEFARGSWIFGSALCSVLRPLEFTAQVVSLYSLCFVGIDTCFAVADPRNYERKRSARLVGGSILGIWVVAFVLTLPVWVFARSVPDVQGNNICTVVWPADSSFTFQTYGLVFVLGLPTAAIACSIIAIFVNSNGKFWRPTSADTAKKTKEIVHLLAAMVFTGYVLCAPSYIIPLARGIRGPTRLSTQDVHMFFTTSCFAFAFSCLKPMLYIFIYTDVCNLVTELIPSRTGNNVKAIRNGWKYNRSPRCSPAKPPRGQHYVDHRRPETPDSTRSFPGSRSRAESRIQLQDIMGLQFTEDGWERKTL